MLRSEIKCFTGVSRIKIFAPFEIILPRYFSICGVSPFLFAVWMTWIVQTISDWIIASFRHWSWNYRMAILLFVPIPYCIIIFYFISCCYFLFSYWIKFLIFNKTSFAWIKRRLFFELFWFTLKIRTSVRYFAF